MAFNKESDFEEALIKVLITKGWEPEVLKYPTEKDLLVNWANILFENNRDVDRLNDYPLTDTEMQQIIEQIETLKTPLKLNGYINGKTISITRDNPDDVMHFGKDVSLKIYDRREIAAGGSRYQIAQQPIYNTRSEILNNRRGDLALLINGMPVIHIELKKTGVQVSQACVQIEKYAREGIFMGIFALVQIFVAMNPEEAVYFANPGPGGIFNPSYYFHWADFNNERIDSWDKVASTLLSIPMAHQLIGFYTVADDLDGVLKVMRSYQYYATNAISDKVSKTKWDENDNLGGYVWHTTGSGKTLTSFKAAQLIASSQDADKVIFLMDRIELGTQSLLEYRGFADADEEVQDTEDSYVLVSKMKSDNPADTLIVTSIQKMSIIGREAGSLKQADMDKINSKRIVFIVDECHRSTFGEMLSVIKKTFPKAIYFGFSGTPILDENQKKMNTTSDVFGSELHRYSIADGIKDKNVLGFDPYMVSTYKDKDIRKAVALEKAKAKDEMEVYSDPKKTEVFNYYMDPSRIAMADKEDALGNVIRGIESYIPRSQYDNDKHRNAVVDDILENWLTYSKNKFHAIFATSSIPEAIEYYRLFKKKKPDLKVTGLFDPSIDNQAGFAFKEDGLEEIIDDYYKRYQQRFTIASYGSMKKDISLRLAHKKPYERISNEPEKQIDLLIVVNQMLTGFDSKWVNTLYLDKVIEYENIIQAFSRTNRLFGPDKPFGIIRYYRKPNTMKQNIEKAVKLYSGDKKFGLFVEKLPHNIGVMNSLYEQIKFVFETAGVQDFAKLPDDIDSRKKFASLFNEFNDYLEAAKIQGMIWRKSEYTYTKDGTIQNIEREIDEKTYLILVQRYKELFVVVPGGSIETPPYDVKPYITDIDTGLIDAEYMNSKFKKFLKILSQPGSTQEEINAVKNELHRTFATLNQEEQKYANIILHEIESGDFVDVEDGKTLRDYITEYMVRAKNDQIHKISVVLGLDEAKLRNIMNLKLNSFNLNEFGRYDDLRKTVDKVKAKEYFEKLEGHAIIQPKVNIKTDDLLRRFILEDGFDMDMPR